jgi:hypothetical protein
MMTAAQYRSRAAALRAKNPKSRAAVLYDRLAKLRGESEIDKLADKYRERLTGDDAPVRENARRDAIITAGGETK